LNTSGGRKIVIPRGRRGLSTHNNIIQIQKRKYEKKDKYNIILIFLVQDDCSAPKNKGVGIFYLSQI